MEVSWLFDDVTQGSKSAASGEQSSKKARSSATGSGCPFNKQDPLMEFRDRVLVSIIFVILQYLLSFSL